MLLFFFFFAAVLMAWALKSEKSFSCSVCFRSTMVFLLSWTRPLWTCCESCNLMLPMGWYNFFFFFFGCIKYMYCAWFSHISLCKEHPMWHLVGWPSLALSEWLLELSVLETYHLWCLFLAMSLEIKTAYSISVLGNWFGVVHCIFLVLPRVTLWPWLGR